MPVFVLPELQSSWNFCNRAKFAGVSGKLGVAAEKQSELSPATQIVLASLSILANCGLLQCG